MRVPERLLGRLLKLVVAGYFGLFLLLVAGWGVWWARFGLPPQQPIAFPHTTHAGRLALPCTFCHTTVQTSAQAGAPPLEVCLSCHRNIATDRPAIRVLLRHAEEKRPIEWVRVHSLPSFVYFPHKRHVKAGVDCAACHGRVAEMTVVRQVRSLQMGWCVTCHQARGAPIDCWTCHI
jgi:hypothetical protein